MKKKAEIILKDLELYNLKEKHPMSLSGGIETESSYSINFMQRFYFYIF